MLRAGTAGWVCDLAAPSGRARLRWGAIPLPPTPTPPALKFHDVQCRYVCPPMPPYLPTRSGDRGGFDVIERGCGMRSAVSERWTGPLRCWDCVAVGVSPGLGVGGRYLSASAVPATRRSAVPATQTRSTSNADQVSSNAASAATQRGYRQQRAQFMCCIYASVHRVCYLGQVDGGVGSGPYPSLQS